MAEVKKQYVNGSNVLMTVNGKGLGHCTTHTVTYNTETKERAVKPPVANTATSGLWSGKGVTKQTISVHGEGFRYQGEEELSLDDVRKMWFEGENVLLSCFERADSSKPYLMGRFIITKVEEASPAQDDATFNIDFENDGEPDLYPGNGANPGDITP